MNCSFPFRSRTRTLHEVNLSSYFFLATLSPFTDLREDKQFFIDHPGAVPITTAQVKITNVPSYFPILLCLFNLVSFFYLKGEELRKLIGAPAYIECSSKTQQVYIFLLCLSTIGTVIKLSPFMACMLCCDCRM